MNVENSHLRVSVPEYYLTDVLPNPCIWSNNHDDGLAVHSVYSISPLAQIQILANKQIHKIYTREQDGWPAVYLQCCQASLRLYFDPWQVYYCFINIHRYYMSCTSHILPLHNYFSPQNDPLTEPHQFFLGSFDFSNVSCFISKTESDLVIIYVCSNLPLH